MGLVTFGLPLHLTAHLPAIAFILRETLAASEASLPAALPAPSGCSEGVKKTSLPDRREIYTLLYLEVSISIGSLKCLGRID